MNGHVTFLGGKGRKASGLGLDWSFSVSNIIYCTPFFFLPPQRCVYIFKGKQSDCILDTALRGKQRGPASRKPALTRPLPSGPHSPSQRVWGPTGRVAEWMLGSKAITDFPSKRQLLCLQPHCCNCPPWPEFTKSRWHLQTWKSMVRVSLHRTRGVGRMLCI